MAVEICFRQELLGQPVADHRQNRGHQAGFGAGGLSGSRLPAAPHRRAAEHREKGGEAQKEKPPAIGKKAGRKGKKREPYLYP
jgi:hypothetical protein